MLSHGAVMKCEYAYTTKDSLSKGSKKIINGEGEGAGRGWRNRVVFFLLT
jgi:hypothetical protein